MLANLFLHYAFDRWMQKSYPDVPFERYADDAICHCKSEAQARRLKQELEARLAECKLDLHPEKIKAVLKKRDFHGIVVADSTMREWRRARVDFWPLEARF